MNVELSSIDNNLNNYRETGDNRHLEPVYKDFQVLARHTLNKIIRTKCHLNAQDKEDIVEDAVTRLIIRIIKRPEYHRTHWRTAIYWEIIKQLYSEHRKKWDQSLSLEDWD